MLLKEIEETYEKLARNRDHDERYAIFLFGRLLAEMEDVDEFDLAFRPNNESPDAILYTKGKDGKEAYCNVEFEGRSSNFKAHGHDPKKCHLIVCTLHDWTEYQVPVLDVKVGRLFQVGKGIEGGYYYEALQNKLRVVLQPNS